MPVAPTVTSIETRSAVHAPDADRADPARDQGAFTASAITGTSTNTIAGSAGHAARNDRDGAAEWAGTRAGPRVPAERFADII